jgi:hypothetical protein
VRKKCPQVLQKLQCLGAHLFLVGLKHLIHPAHLLCLLALQKLVLPEKVLQAIQATQVILAVVVVAVVAAEAWGPQMWVAVATSFTDLILGAGAAMAARLAAIFPYPARFFARPLAMRAHLDLPEPQGQRAIPAVLLLGFPIHFPAEPVATRAMAAQAAQVEPAVVAAEIMDFSAKPTKQAGPGMVVEVVLLAVVMGPAVLAAALLVAVEVAAGAT